MSEHGSELTALILSQAAKKAIVRTAHIKKFLSVTVILFVALILNLQIGHTVEITLAKDTSLQVYFSPNGGCTEAIISGINLARSEILVQAYSFTSALIAKILVGAYKRGVRVLAILDKSQRSERYTSATFLTNARIPTYIDAMHAIAHSKIMIIDRAMAITGSFNFTKAVEENNAENLLIISSKELARIYLENWQKHREHS